jgi:hypothetical protein
VTSVIPFFVLPVFLYQGLTETCGGLSIQDLDDFRSGIAGVPLPSNEVKLESCPEINDKLGKPYLISDREDHEGNPILGRGKQSKLGIVWIVVCIYIYMHIYIYIYTYIYTYISQCLLLLLTDSLSFKYRRDSCERLQYCCWILHDARYD